MSDLTSKNKHLALEALGVKVLLDGESITVEEVISITNGSIRSNLLQLITSQL